MSNKKNNREKKNRAEERVSTASSTRGPEACFDLFPVQPPNKKEKYFKRSLNY